MNKVNMMSSFGALLATSLAMTAPAMARTEFRGGGYLSDFEGCEEYGWQGVETTIVRVRPAELEGNPEETRVSMFFGTYALNIRIFDDARDGEFVPVRFSGLGSSAWTPGEDEQIMRMRFLSLFPRDVEEDTARFDLGFEFANFEGLEGCSARGHFTVALR